MDSTGRTYPTAMRVAGSPAYRQQVPKDATHRDGFTRRALLLAGGAAGIGLTADRSWPMPVARKGAMLPTPAGSRFVLRGGTGGITSLRYRGDSYDTAYVRADAALGRVCARIRRDGTAWQTLDAATGGPLSVEAKLAGVLLRSAMTVVAGDLRWDIAIRNDGANAVEVGDLMLPLPMNTNFAGGQSVTASVLKHSFVSGHGSHIFWMRANSVGPYLMLLPEGDTHLEYWDVQPVAGGSSQYCAYIHAGAAAAETAATGTRWRQPVSTLTLAPGEERRHAFRFSWVTDYAAARRAIATAGGIDVEVVPGMTVPSDLTADIALASALPVIRIEPEHASTTEIVPLPPRAGRQLWRVRFRKPGENRLTLHQAGGRRTHLEFFATEPVETMMKKRGAFIARRQHRDPAKWYDGLFGEWNMATGTLLGPDNYDRIKGWRIYEVTCDDPGLSKPAYLAAKNAEHPVAGEVAALDRYIETFVWGGLQQTLAEQYPYGIYGIPDWKTNRDSPDPGPKGRRHIWRPYDYPHIFAMYLAMYRIAHDHPAIPTRLAAADYLRRAYGTAVAMFTIPMKVTGWSAYTTGFYNECVIPELVETLRTAGMPREAATLEAHWARKVRTFVDPHADLFGSEYPFDSTGFESTQALARSALDAPVAMGVTAPQARAFADRQIAANLFCRGWLEPAYYYLGSDYRGSAGDSYTLTYMAQMGGWAVLDHALNDAADPHPLLRLGYASQLSAWALLNSGPAESGYGYWYPGEAHDGGAGGGFEPAPAGTTWLDQPHHRGSWYYSCEIDLGFCGAMRAAATILTDDPVFGRICLGGTMEEADEAIRIVPRDGVRRRLNVRLDRLAFDMTLRDARFAPGLPVVVDAHDGTIGFAVEPFVAGATRVGIALRPARRPWSMVTLPIVAGRVTIRIGNLA